MKELNFLKTLKRKRIIEIIEPSEEMKSSYLEKSENCLKSSKILFQNNLYENATAEAYYSMYNALLAILSKIGIKSENHSASIILFDKLLNETELTKIILWAKEERIDKQYYVETKQTTKTTKNSCDELISKSEDFLIKIKILINHLNNENIIILRKKFNKI